MKYSRLTNCAQDPPTTAQTQILYVLWPQATKSRLSPEELVAQRLTAQNSLVPCTFPFSGPTKLPPSQPTQVS